MYHSVLNHLEAIIMANKEVQDLITVSTLILICNSQTVNSSDKKIRALGTQTIRVFQLFLVVVAEHEVM